MSCKAKKREGRQGSKALLLFISHCLVFAPTSYFRDLWMQHPQKIFLSLTLSTTMIHNKALYLPTTDFCKFLTPEMLKKNQIPLPLCHNSRQ